ncbi:MAG: DegV family protein [Ruminococcaceae bacterium]|nr:DegV family protein [Oscillospiraceae bacterium]
MSNFVIISDTSCDLNAELRERFGIADYARGYVHLPDGSAVQANLDWTEEESNAFFKALSDKKANFKTATPSIGEVEDVMDKQLKEGNDILCVTLSTGLSGMYGVFVNAAKDMKEKYPDRKIVVVDSMRYSTSEGMVCVLASQYRAEGKTIEETAELLDANKCRVHQIGWMDDLFYCKKMGRVSGGAAVMGTLVGIKAMADFNHKGMSHVLGKTRGYKNAYRHIIEYMKETGEELENQIVFIAHAVREEQALEVKKLIEEEIKPKEIIVTTVGQGSAPNIGPGLVAAFYMGAPISENAEKEMKIFEAVSAKIK